MPEEEIINDTPSDKDDSDTNSQATSKKSRKSKESKVPHEYKKQIKSLSGGSLLPSEVFLIVNFGSTTKKVTWFKLEISALAYIYSL